jgi:hypothetical protein
MASFASDAPILERRRGAADERIPRYNGGQHLNNIVIFTPSSSGERYWRTRRFTGITSTSAGERPAG